MATMYYEKDCDRKFLEGKKIAVIGYGSQGHAHALNLRDSGFDVTIGLYEGSKSAEAAKKAGLPVMLTRDAVAACDVVMVLVNDEKQAALYKNDIAPALKPGKTLAFAHGFNIHFGQIVVPKDVAVIMIAPKGPGHTVRSQFQEGKGVPCLIAVEQDPRGDAKGIALAWAAGIGGARAGVLETTFREETETDLFGEQAVLCGGASSLVQAGFETLVEAGYQPEIAYYEVLHELKLIVDLFYEGGISRMLEFVSETAQYGDYVSGPRVIDASTKARMKEVLKDIQDGTFTKNWVAEYEAGLPNYNRFKQADLEHPIEKVGKELRAKMVWLQGQAA